MGGDAFFTPSTHHDLAWGIKCRASYAAEDEETQLERLLGELVSNIHPFIISKEVLNVICLRRWSTVLSASSAML